MHVAAPQRERNRTSGTRRAPAAARIVAVGDSASDGGRAPPRPDRAGRRGARRRCSSCAPRAELARRGTDRGDAPHALRPTARARPRASSTSGTPSSTAARRTRRCRTGSSSLRSGPSSTIAAARSRSAIVGAREPEHDFGRQPVAELGVDVVGAEHALGEARPRVRVLVGAACAAEQRDRLGTVQVERARGAASAAASSASGHDTSSSSPSLRTMRLADAGCRSAPTRSRSGPCRTASPWFTGSESTPSRRTSRFDVDCERAPALHRARVARRLDRLEVPRPGLEPVRRRGERADRADLHGVAGEVRGERLLGVVEHLGAVAAVDEVDQRVAGDLVGEAGAARRTGCSARGRAARGR